MRSKYILLKSLVVLCFVFVVSSCTEQEELLTGGTPAVFTPLIKEDVDAGASSRATNNTWKNGDRVGIYMIKSGNSLTTSNLADNVEYMVAADGPNTSLVPVNSTIYYPVDDSKVNFVAYYPYQSGIGTNNIYTVNVANQTTPAAHYACDLLYNKENTNYDRYNAAATLIFKHQLSKVVVNVSRGSDISGSLAALDIKIAGTPTQTNFDLATGKLSTELKNTASITLNKTSSTQAAVSREAILIPHAGSKYTSRSITFTLGTTTYTYQLPATQDFISGYKYTYNLTFTASGVALKEVVVSDWTGGSATWNSAILTTNKNVIETDYPGGTYTVIINTTSAKSPTYAFSTADSSITGTINWINYTKVSGTTKDGWTTWTYTFDINNNTDTTNDRDAYIHFSIASEKLSIPIKVEQKRMRYAKTATTTDIANCYIVPPGSSLTFPASNYFSSLSSGTYTVEKQWDDNNVLSTQSVTGSGSNTRITVTATNMSGNALVILKNAYGQIVWSYHIWVTTYNPNTDGTWTPNAGSINPRRTFMDRSLGATTNDLSYEAYGLYYQWGRKDPFPKEDIEGFSKKEVYGVTENEAIQNPGVFYSAENTQDGNWLYGYGDKDYLWVYGEEEDVYFEKTYNDPCPAGWQLPRATWYIGDINYSPDSDPLSPLEGLQNITFPNNHWGTILGENAKWAVGGTMIAYGTTSGGNYWTATAYDKTEGLCLYVNGNVYVCDYNYRYYGMQVRCVMEKN